MNRARSNFTVALSCFVVLCTASVINACLMPDGTSSCLTSCVPPAPAVSTRPPLPSLSAAPRVNSLGGESFSTFSFPSLPPELRVRRNVGTMDGPARQLFVDAIKDMKAAPKKGTNAAVGNRYDEFVLMHGNNCNHRNSGFLPWHRKLLWEFETEVRALNPVKYANFAIPYWDWTRTDFPQHLVDTDADNNFMGPTGAGANNIVAQGPFRAGQWTTFEQVGGRNDLVRKFTDINKLKTDGPTGRDNMLNAGNYTNMSNISEQGPELHDGAHIRVGGFFIDGSGNFVPIGHLADVDSGADDPIFWMLHSYIDMLWTTWQVGPNGSLTAYTQFGGGPALGANLTQFGNAGNNIGFNNTANNTVADQLDPFDTNKLGYRYDVIPEPAGMAIVLSLCALVTRRYRSAA